MRWFHQKKFEDITIEDIQRLVDDNTRESLHLEYKRDLKADGNNKLNREIGKDISAFSNTEGGDYIIGVAEHKAEDELELVGVEGTRDDLELRFHALIRDNISPTVRVEIKAIAYGERFVILVRVPRSLDAPHRNEGQNDKRFWRRHPNGAAEMTTEEVRDTVLQRRDIYERAGAWRDARIAMHETGEGPVSLKPGPRLYVHAVPLGFQEDVLPLHTEIADRLYGTSRLPGFVNRDYFGAYVHDASHHEGLADRFEAWMNNGAFEVSMAPHVFALNGSHLIYAPDIEEHVQIRCDAHTRVLEDLLGNAAWLVFVSLRECKGHFYLYTKRPDLDARFVPLPIFTSNDVRCPPVYLAERPGDTDDWRTALKPAFDRLAQSANTKGSRVPSQR